jgi:hypothetical protein
MNSAGRLGTALGLLLALGIGTAAAAEVELLYPEGPPMVGQPIVLEVVVEEEGRGLGTLPLLSLERGQLLGNPASPATGRHQVLYLPPNLPGNDSLRVKVGSQEFRFDIPVAALPPAPPMAAPLEAVVGVERLQLRFPRGESSDPSSYLARTSEGKVLSVRVEGEEVLVEVQPDDRRMARVVVVGLLSLEHPHQIPVFAQARLRARQQASIGAEPGSKVSLRVGSRTFGPFVADSSGQAQVSFEIPPGVTAYEVQVTDDLGNSQKVRSSLPGPFPPALLAMDAPDFEGRADLWLGAWTANGTAWTEEAPTCRAGADQPQPTIQLAPGLFRLNLPPGDPNRLDIRVECTLAESAAALRLPAVRPGPARLELRVYPEQLSSDFPVADVGVSLMDIRGEPLPAEGVQLRAMHGRLVTEPVTGTVLRAEYRGEGALSAGGDLIEAFWFEPAGSGGVWRLSLASEPIGERLRVRVRVEDRLGYPLEGVPVRLEPEGVEPLQLRSGPRGEVEVEIGDVRRIRATAAGLSTELRPLRGDLLPPAAAPELAARRELGLQAGRVRKIELDIDPVPLVIGSGQNAVLRVRLVDASGQVVRDEPVEIQASEGSLGPQSVAADGTITVDYVPSSGGLSRQVELQARSSNSVATATLPLVPRPVSGGITLTGGYLTNFGAVSSPTLWATVDGKIPGLSWPLRWRAGLGFWNLRSRFTSATFGEEVFSSTTFFPVELGVELVQRRGRTQLQAGLAAVVVPYYYSLSFAGEQGPTGPAITTPGLLVHLGGALRIGNSELPVELRYLLVTASGSAVRFDGSPGGLALTLGYRYLY